MANARRLESQVRACRGNDDVFFTGTLPSRCRGTSLPDAWATHVIGAGLDRRAEALRHERARRESGPQESALAVEARKAAEEAQMRKKTSDELRRRLAEEVALRKHVATVEDANFRAACAASPDLRALQRQCDDQQAAREQALQLMEQEVRDEENRIREQTDAEAREFRRLREVEAATRQEFERRRRGATLREQLRAQSTAYAASVAETRFRERAADKFSADAAAAKIRDEDERKHMRKRQLQDEVQAALDRLIEQRLADKACEQRRDLEETHEAEAYVRRCQEIAVRLAAERRRVDSAREASLHRLSEDLASRARHVEEFAALREELQREEQVAKQRRQEIERLERQLESRLAAVRAHREDMKNVQERRSAAKEEEEQWRKTFLARLAEEDRVEQMGVQRRRAVLAEHRRSAERHSDEQRRLRNESFAKEQREADLRREEDERHVAIIEAEMLRLLHEYTSVSSGGRAVHARSHSVGSCVQFLPAQRASRPVSTGRCYNA
eukprot:TRINITY_DN55428_c0_g1_i1.p1 TRINITY_DN55428_c0_g1~~TRINITY_DN55428_c0_g1_i1.p1  ORF type:complete len:523 (-),score=114.38 TRINITY_DN55428_c0_g1_i1:67-1569(-)